MKKSRKDVINAYLLSYSIFQFGLLQPLVVIMKSQWVIGVFLVLATLVSIYVNRAKVNRNYLVVFFLVSIVFFSQSIIYSRVIVLGVYFEFIIKCATTMYIASFYRGSDYSGQALTRLAILNFVTLTILLILGYVKEVGYMRFGYSMLPSVLVFIHTFFIVGFRKKTNIIFLLLSIFEMIVYGSRGPILCVLLFLFIYFMNTNQLSRSKKVFSIVTAGITVFLAVYYNFVVRIMNFIIEDLKIYTYSLAKYKMQIERGLFSATSGRDMLYEKIIGIAKNNIFWGNGIGVVQSNIEGYTAHNMFLQILVEFGINGVIIGIVVSLVLIYFFLKTKRNPLYFFVCSLLLSLSIGRLLVSSDIWIRPELWMAIVLILNYNKVEKVVCK